MAYPQRAHARCELARRALAEISFRSGRRSPSLGRDDKGVSAEPDDHGPRALLVLYDDALPVVYGYFVRRCSDRGTAEDLTSETFLAAMDAARLAAGGRAEGTALLRRRGLDGDERSGAVGAGGIVRRRGAAKGMHRGVPMQAEAQRAARARGRRDGGGW